ncbi:hypothetical protein [Nocardia xishanensis]
MSIGPRKETPHVIGRVVSHRLVYRPHVRAPYVYTIERQAAELHLERLVRAGTVTVSAGGTFVQGETLPEPAAP